MRPAKNQPVAALAIRPSTPQSLALNNMAHELPTLPYALNALEPHIDARTMEIHHGKHHQTYVTMLNKALEPQLLLAEHESGRRRQARRQTR